MKYPIQLVSLKYINQIAAITNAEAKHSVATVALRDEPLERWIHNWQTNHAYYPWLVAINPQLDSTNQVIAYAKAAPYNPREGFVWSVTLSIYVKPAYQGQQISRALYHQLFSILKAQNYLNLYARIALPNPASQILHEKFGLQQSGVLTQFAYKFNRWLNMGIFTGTLDGTARIDNPFHMPHEILSVDKACKDLEVLSLLSNDKD
jgi:L-amino acid N-acyltransferase YncA